MVNEYEFNPEPEPTPGDQYHDLWETLNTAIKARYQEQIKRGSEPEDVELSIDFDPDTYFLEGRIRYGLYCIVEHKPTPPECELSVLKKEVDDFLKENEHYFKKE